MKRIILAVVGVLTVSTGTDAQSTAQMIERALLAAPARGRDAVTVVKWNADYSYETLREGTNQMVCYDRSGDPGQRPFAVQCTVLGNLDRVAQNRRFAAEGGDAAGESRVGGRRCGERHTSQCRVWVGVDRRERCGSGERRKPYDCCNAGCDRGELRLSREPPGWWCFHHGCRYHGGPPHDALRREALRNPDPLAGSPLRRK